ncbi:Transcription elongation factor TFIIS [Euphorbia peplus]|nr:Transcription elongation factor TFIIS [Euphorbia peplus]
METQLLELFEAAKKAADAAAIDGVSSSGPEVGRCVDALKLLKAFPISYDILVSSQVGKRLRPLTKHPREKIQTMASDLLELWKKIVIDETTKKKNGTIENKSSVKAEISKVETVKVEKVQKANGVKVEKIAREETVKIEKIATKEEKKVSNVKRPPQSPVTPKLTGMVKSNDAMRDKIRELLVEALARVASEVDEERRDEVNACDPIRVAVSVESAMFDKWGKSTGNQKTKYRSVMFNIKDQKNPDFRRKVLLGEVKPERIINMSVEEMASDQRQQENNQIKEKALFDCERAGAPKATTDQFKCGRCGQRKTTYYQMQTRSADEPMTTYVTCVNCNNHWKFC